MLGMIIGIGSVVAITSIGQGVQKSTEKQIQALGTNVMMVMAGASKTQAGISQGIGSSSTLTWEDAEVIAEQVTVAKAVTAYLQKPSVQVIYGDENVSTTIIGTDLNYSEVKNIYPEFGLFFTQADLDSARSVAVLGAKVRDQLFGNRDPVGEVIRIQQKSYQVIGVMEAKGAVGSQDQDDMVYIPLTNMSLQLVGNNALSGTAITGLWLLTDSSEELDTAQFQVTNLLRLRHNIYPPDDDDFNITNQVDIINTFNTVMSTLTLMVSAVAGISLVVGGIGIANIMLVTVVERTKEVGLRKALGATNQTVQSQFLIEAVLVSTVGGSIGIGGGIVLAAAAATAFQIPLIISVQSIVAGFSLSIAVGLAAGVVPAQNAARLDPIVALRSE
ncbi:MAG: ABC transporter permease [Pegethrix bostrychoides GSE-TBD4-15B]|uniref:ABC transporter permease n=1 Tax=Pegethrix bostrychoides GSE-TBD4-15B TaxID=2839662 RepID=A0A951P827_9CYAN|nr:ABC transporter permease [Pegethrix bostrychoides GSE-TBD4-15B]